MRTRTTGSWLAAALVALALPGVASAQTTATGSTTGDAAAGLTTTALTTVGIALSGIGVYVISSKGDDHARSAAALQYLRQHSLQVRQDICLGHGPMVAELAKELGLTRAQGSALGVQLRKQRKEFLTLVDPTHLTSQRAWQFFDAVRRLAEQSRKAG